MEKNPVNQKTKIQQKSETESEKTFVKQDKGIKNTLELF